MTKPLQEIAVNYSDNIIEKAKQGDERAFNKLVGLWFRQIYHFCLKYFDDHDTAMETTQKTFIALYKHLPGIRDNDSLKYWLFKVARNQCYEEGRRKSRRTWLSIFQNKEVHHQADPNSHPEIDIHRTEKENLVGLLLQKIPEEQRVVIIMKEFEDMKFKEIAEVLDVSINTVKSRLYYGLNSLRKHIDKSGFNYREDI